MLKKMFLLPGTLATALVIGGCEEGDFEGDVGQPDVQTETEVIEPETGAAPPADSPQMEQESEFQLDQPAAETGQPDASTSDPVDVQQNVESPEQQQEQQPSGQAADDADAVEEVPAESLPGENQSGNPGSGNQGSGNQGSGNQGSGSDQ